MNKPGKRLYTFEFKLEVVCRRAMGPPRTGGEVGHRAWTSDRQLRHSSWRGPRPDRSPDGVKLPVR
ncbi:hypothetical protein GCM10022267_83680 [Lentzea roselyniae]|uniref:Transposase n=2 Tax=Lentzea roselyniae TaxID=531940 RepID=A0ABP7CD82_9PSEU